VAGDPSTSRSGARTFAGSPATWRLLSLRGWGGAPRNSGETASSMELCLYGIAIGGERQRATPAAAGSMAVGWRACHPLRLALSLEKTDPEAVDSAETACEGTLSAEMRYSCAACHTLHDAARDRQWPEHSGQRPRESGAWVASSALHPWVNRGSSLRATDSSEPLSALFASSSSMSSRSHTACRRIWPRIWSTSQLHLSALGLPALPAAASRELQSRKSRHPPSLV
jgi:hypothetical protein